MKKISLIILFFILPFLANAQEKKIETFAIVDKGDTIPMSYLKEFIVSGYASLLNLEEQAEYSKLIRNVKKTYPYAKQAGQLLESYNLAMKDMTPSQKKQMMKQAEKEIKDKFEADLKKLTRSQGEVLIKLIDRETGNDSYTLVKELRGSFSAFLYQSLGKIFGYNLKTKFNPKENKEDEMIEKIIYGIETNKI
jgi:nucleoside diphosphate kinase